MASRRTHGALAFHRRWHNLYKARLVDGQRTLRTERDHNAMRFARTYQLFCGSGVRTRTT